MYWVAVPLAFAVGFFSGHRRGYLKALQAHVAELKAFAKQVDRRA